FGALWLARADKVVAPPQVHYPAPPPAGGGISGGSRPEPFSSTQEQDTRALQERSANNLKQIGLAFHNFHDVHNHCPGDVVAKDGPPLLSRRVAILRFIDEENLYTQFHLDEPWDSDHNLKLLSKIPKVYLTGTEGGVPAPGMGPADPIGTFYQGFAGPHTAF